MKREIVFVTILILMLIPSFGMADTRQASILVIYGSVEDKVAFNTMIGDLNQSQYQITTIAANELNSTDIGNQDAIIVASSVDFSMDDPVQQALQTYMQDSNHHLLFITPYLDELNGDLSKAIGINTIIEHANDENSSLQWTITLGSDYLNYTNGDSFQYTGLAPIVTLESTTNTIAQFSAVTGNNESSNIVLPSPAIWNSTQPASVSVIAVSLNSTAVTQENRLHTYQGMQLDQIGDFINSIVKDIVVTVLHQAVINVNGPSTGGTPVDNSTTGTNTDNTTGNATAPSTPGIPGLPNLPGNISSPAAQFSLIALLLGLLWLLYAKIVAFVSWLLRKFYGLAFFVIGAFYNIQDRTLTHNEVTMNNSRADILVYLNHVGSYGAHLREIKSVTGLGSGSLLWHLQVLEDYGYIDKFIIGSYTIFVADGFTLDSNLKEIELKLQSKYTFDLLDFLAHLDVSTVSLAEMEEETYINRRPLRRLINKLADDQLLTIDKYPQMTITIVKFNEIRDLYHSFNLRETFKFETHNPHVEYIDEEEEE